jgi:hypothetical protein
MKLFTLTILLTLSACAFIEKKKQEQEFIGQELTKRNLPGVWHSTENFVHKRLIISKYGNFEINALNCSGSSQAYIECALNPQEVKGDVNFVSDNQIKVFAIMTLEYSFTPVVWDEGKKQWNFTLDGELFFRENQN